MKRTTVGLLVGCLLVFGWLVWPTPYRYLTWHSNDYTAPVRISRVTGRADFLAPDGWRRMGPPRPAPTSAVQQSRDRLREIEAELGIDSATEARIKARIEARARKP